MDTGVDLTRNASRDAGAATALDIGLPRSSVRILSGVVKRCFDITASLLLLVTIMPMLAAIALLIAMDGGPAFFIHKRVGRGGKTFGCLKFRTMIPDAEHTLTTYLDLHPEAAEEWRKTQKLAFDPRVTAIGKALRHSSLDELPQLINVLKGEMSLVGPRPVTQPELEHYGAHASHYWSVRPGLTGLWQVSGRNDLSYEQRVRMDVWYVQNRSLLLDARILLKTPKVVVSKAGAR